MKTLCLTTLTIILFATMAFSQNLTQTVRGTISDSDSKSPLKAAELIILGSNPLIGTTTNEDGNFRLENIPVGRITIQVIYLGYESKIIPDIVVNSGKEVVLDLSMRESTIKMDEIVVNMTKNKGEAINKMSLISARSISAEETQRYAGGFSDPSRLLTSFAGVANTQNGENDIIVRGNSPKYVQWRLEGMEISNPTHFGDQNSIKGGISSINNNLLATSDFYTGAFSPEYGNALSGVYDVKLRAGNNEKFESTFGFGVMGTELTLEGPFKKGYAGSYLVNYRYSTVSMINDLGLVDVEGDLRFQDFTFKFLLPTKKAGTFSIFGLGGKSGFFLNDIEPDGQAIPDANVIDKGIRKDYEKDNYLFNSGINHTLSLTDNSFLKTSLSYSTSKIKDNIYESARLETDNDEDDKVSDVDGTLNYSSKLKKSTYSGAITYNNKLNAKNRIQVGTKYSLLNYDYTQSWLEDNKLSRTVAVDFNENITTLNNFISWKHRFNDKVTMVSGLHNMNVLYNKKSTFEPRFAIDWKLSNRSSVKFGYGKHSNMESVHNYFAKVEQEDGSITEPNKDLDLLKAHHFVVAYEKRFSKNLMAKVELYYQHLFDLPVENNDTSYYATINEGTDFRYVDLVNEGSGKNYGVEFTLERFFDKNYYFLINASLYDSKYKSLEGVERNTRYNGNYLVNILCGKEFVNLGKKRNQTLALNAKAFFGGGQKYIPLLRDAQGNVAVDPENDNYWDYEKAYDNRLDNIFQLNLSASYKFNRPKATHEIFIDLINVTNNMGKMFEYYDASELNSVGHVTQFGFFPNLMYRVYF